MRKRGRGRSACQAERPARARAQTWNVQGTQEERSTAVWQERRVEKGCGRRRDGWGQTGLSSPLGNREDQAGVVLFFRQQESLPSFNGECQDGNCFTQMPLAVRGEKEASWGTRGPAGRWGQWARLDGLHPWPRTPGKDVSPQWSSPLRAPLTNGL